MVTPYIPNTQDDQNRIMETIGISSVDELFRDIPRDRLNPSFDLPGPMAEADLLRELQSMAAKNWTLDVHTSFLGDGSTNRFVPSIVGHIIGRNEFLTAYTPYQPEVSQGILQAIYEYQSLVSQLFQMDATNAGMYDGASALAEAALMACRQTKRNRVAVRKSISPLLREVLETYLNAQEIEIVENVDDESACLIVQQPNHLGVWESTDGLADETHSLGALLVCSVDPLSLGMFAAPGSYGADIVVAEGQSLGIAPSFGGPGLGIFSCRKEYVRQMPSRIVGRTFDGNGKEGFVLTLQTREQHIRREKATSNICTNETLLAIATAVYLAALGPKGLRQVSELAYHKAHYAAKRIGDLSGFSVNDGDIFFDEFVVQCPQSPEVTNQYLLDKGILGGIDVSSSVPNGLLLCVTELVTRDQIDELVSCFERMEN